ncbi:PREDICTED: MKRN2 opposite strand protein [Pygoscelis adeliae]|uniref:MKRN2 opposite strand protein n=1 Tax=Pygoscelis adeliae TaxID=9238 RepID=UPI0004F4F6EA|nr:PREDICTED: MKRN2 opposite strand protein [Pygoscelis adeliae]
MSTRTVVLPTGNAEARFRPRPAPLRPRNKGPPSVLSPRAPTRILGPGSSISPLRESGGARTFLTGTRSAGAQHPHRCVSFRGYDGKSDLHVGITNSNGVVYNYNEEGIHRAETGWEQCISIPLVQPDMFGLLQQWDALLEEFSVGEAWLPHRYEEHDHNCYTYALAFINSVLTAQGKRQMSKSEFTEKFVIPQTKKASKYITLHQELTANDFYIVPLPDQEKQC